MNRPSWDDYFLDLADHASTRATCPRLSVGCVLVDADRQIVSTGYNGSPRGTVHCSEAGCLLSSNHCIRAVHAEANAVAQAARRGASLGGSTAYVNVHPCPACYNLLVQAGVRRIVYRTAYKNQHAGMDTLIEAAGVRPEQRLSPGSAASP